MKSMKTVAAATLLAGCAALVGATAFAADTAVSKDIKARCEKEAKGLVGEAHKAALKKCEADAKK
jgi:hypothetical protein